MIKIKATLLRFDKFDLLGIIFPKNCKIDIPDFIPLTYSDQFNIVGQVIKTDRDDFSVEIEGFIDCFNPELENEFKNLINTKDQDLFVGGYYQINEEHKDNNMRVMDSLVLKSVGLYLDDIYGDKSTKVKIVN